MSPLNPNQKDPQKPKSLTILGCVFFYLLAQKFMIHLKEEEGLFRDK